MVRHVSLNDYLSARSSWPRRLLGWEPYAVRRDEDHVGREYDRDRYAPLLDPPPASIEECKRREFELLGMPPEKPEYFSLGEEIFVAPVATLRQLWYATIAEAVQRRRGAGPLCELGCGYGYNLTYLGADAYGGERSENAVALARRFGLDVAPFDYYDRDSYALLRPRTTVLTVHSVEQLPDATPVIEGLAARRDAIDAVIHLEPGFLPERETLLGMIRNRYNELIDHNRNLVALLRARSDVEILAFEADVFGVHPLNSTNLVVWRFR
ncbi:MAG TPA: hypothetical protein VFB22_06460 [Candidatus Baltobacteraceae bacterium]|nr:hypothetical protein [Candidatus Baltobacteraceae bacterium]